MERRSVLKTAMAAGAASALISEKGHAEGEVIALPVKIIDSNVSLFRWPFRRLPLDEVDVLLAKFRRLGITQAWAGSYEGILHRDLDGVNRRLAELCVKHPQLIPIGSINPELPDWENDLIRCRETYNMSGIRLLPNYHGYTLADRRFARLLELAAEAKLLIQIAVSLEDPRTQRATVRAPDVDLEPLADLLKNIPDARVQILNWRPRSLMTKLAEVPGVFFDTARVESTDGVAKLIRSVPAGRVMFGTHAPFLIPEAALIRVHESNLGEDELRSVLEANARQVLRNLNA